MDLSVPAFDQPAFLSCVTSALRQQIICMPRPDAVRRVKSYSASDGYVYQ